VHTLVPAALRGVEVELVELAEMPPKSMGYHLP
jgi:hypothetical protein